MYITKHGLLSEGKKDAEWGTFISPDKELESLENPNDKLNVFIPSGIKADFTGVMGINNKFDAIVNKIILQRDKMSYEEQCSGQYYFDCFIIVEKLQKQIARIAEVGTYLGGASCIFAGCAEEFNIELDLIEAKKEFLLYTYERLRRAFPNAAKKVRLFYGNMHAYITNVVQKEKQTKIMFHHDAGHNYNQVLNDIASLYFVREKTTGLIIQDTHLRSAKVDNFIFVDAAVFSAFGFAAKFTEIGMKYSQTTQPNYKGQTYFIDQHPEGFFIPFAENSFQFPHPTMTLEEIDTFA